MENKLDNINMRIDVTSLILVAYPLVDQCYQTSLTKLSGKKATTLKTNLSIRKDLDQIDKFIKVETCFTQNPILILFNLKKLEALEKIEENINSSDKKGFLLIILGSDISKVSETKLVIYNSVSEEYKPKNWLMHFQTILRIWDKRPNKAVCQHLLLILDFRYSGDWVEQLMALKRDDITIQSSMKTEKTKRLILKEESVFFNNFLFANNLIECSFKEPTPIYPHLNPLSDYELKSPGFFGSADLVASVFGLNVGFNSWDEIRKAALLFPTNSYYIGQTSPVFDPYTHTLHRYPDGFGAIFCNNAELICVGQFVCGFMGSQEIAKMSKDSSGRSYTKVVQVDKSGAISYGRVEKKQLEGQSIVIDKDGNALFGNYHHNQLEGKGTLETYYGGKWEGKFHHGHAKGLGKFTYPSKSGQSNITPSRRSVRFEVFNLKGSFAKFQVQGRLIQNSTLTINDVGYHAIGRFKQNLQHGPGLLVLPQGFIIEAEWNHGFINKLIKVTDVLLIKVPAELLTKSSNGRKFYIDKTGHAFFGTVYNGCQILDRTNSNLSASNGSQENKQSLCEIESTEKKNGTNSDKNLVSNDASLKQLGLSPPVLRIEDEKITKKKSDHKSQKIKKLFKLKGSRLLPKLSLFSSRLKQG